MCPSFLFKNIPCFLLTIAMLLTLSPNFSIASDAPSAETYALLEQFHGHVCGGSLFGARLGQAAKEALRAAGGEGKLKSRYYDLSCPVDGIQVTAGTTYGNAALVVEDRDEHRLVLTAEGNKRQVEARLTPKASEMALRSRELGKKARLLPNGSSERRALELEVAEIFDWFRSAPTTGIVVITPMDGR